MKHKNIALLLLFLFLFVYRGAFSETTDDIQAKYLKGIKWLRVSIESLGVEATKIGLTRERLKTITELRLRREGIIIKTEKDISVIDESRGNIPIVVPILYVNANVGDRAYSIDLEIQEAVRLERDPSIICLATTWVTGIMGTHGKKQELIITALSELLDDFLNDYYKANPKKKD